MSPPKQPCSLFQLCIKSSISLINSACYVIEKTYPENKFHECEREAFDLKCQLMLMLPARLFDVLCSERTCCQYRGDPRIQLQVLTHPNMTVFRKCDLDNSIPQRFWIATLSTFSRLVILDLKFICTDEILQVVGENCPLLEEINIVSRVDICKSLFNASVLIRNVSDAGLCSVAKLKRLRILAMDPPRNERANRIGRCVSQGAIILLMNELPNLEELRIESCDIGSTLISTVLHIGPLSLRKMNCHFASAEGIKKLIRICPFLRELSVTHLSEHNKDAILEQISASHLRLNRLFDVLCSERTCCQYRGDPRIQLQVLTHPNMTVFRKCDLDNSIPQRFWIATLSTFSRLVILDLKFICTDEILQVVGENCPLLEEINIVSRVDICKSLFNASVLIRNVSDAGLCSVAKLKRLRILAMDPPRNERANRIGRCVSQGAIILLMNELPNLEELRIESCDIGSTLISTVLHIGPLSLRKMNCHFASAEGIKKLIRICPFLRELSVTHLSEHNKDAILEQISASHLRLNRLDLSFFSYTDSMQQLLLVKGSYLTHFSLWEIDHSLTLDAIISLAVSFFSPATDNFKQHKLQIKAKSDDFK
uniref:Uncharacterized protein n=1 Tax=Heliothis virescens TaxID=7102 RepID=A0A2A4JQS5_HELVI